MGIGGIGIGPLLLILAIIILLFGTKKLKNVGGDLGSAIKGFKKAMNNDAEKNETGANDAQSAHQIKVDEGENVTSATDKTGRE